MKLLKWLAELANTKPITFAIVLLLIVAGALSKVVIDRDRKLSDCNFNTALRENYFRAREDSIIAYFTAKDINYSAEMKETLNSIIADYKEQLQKQQQVNENISTTITKSRSLIKKTKAQIQTIKDEK